jgi:hypothetical protein
MQSYIQSHWGKLYNLKVHCQNGKREDRKRYLDIKWNGNNNPIYVFTIDEHMMASTVLTNIKSSLKIQLKNWKRKKIKSKWKG